MSQKSQSLWQRARNWLNKQVQLDVLFALLDRPRLGLKQFLRRGLLPKKMPVPKCWRSYQPKVEGLEVRVMPTTVQLASYDAPAISMYGSGNVTSILMDVSMRRRKTMFQSI